MRGLVDTSTRKHNLYRPGSWERGGWFEVAQHDTQHADTKPSGEPPNIMPSDAIITAAAVDDPFVKEDKDSKQTVEQQRLADVQALAHGDPRQARSTADLAGAEDGTAVEDMASKEASTMASKDKEGSEKSKAG